MSNKVLPKLGVNAFNCPHCNAYTQQVWKSHARGKCFSGFIGTDDMNGWVYVSTCALCGNDAVWIMGKLVFPRASLVSSPNPDLGSDIVMDYNEAASILQDSPRGACAILRLAAQKLCRQLGEKGKNLNEDIASLVKKGLSPRIQKSLDTLRVIGNNAVHPGEFDISDTPDVAMAL